MKSFCSKRKNILICFKGKDLKWLIDLLCNVSNSRFLAETYLFMILPHFKIFRRRGVDLSEIIKDKQLYQGEHTKTQNQNKQFQQQNATVRSTLCPRWLSSLVWNALSCCLCNHFDISSFTMACPHLHPSTSRVQLR